jgi:formate dehydrogenase iron-sulfur subunit
MSFAILTDTTRCTGCERCVDACVEVNHLGQDVRYRWREADGLNGARYCSVVQMDAYHWVRKQCRHCLVPACATACPVGALHKTEEGPVVYDRDICMGCRYCMMACPYEIPRYMWEETVPYISKCTMCYEAMQRGEIEQPACTEACEEQATTFFTSREEALAEARRRIAANPGHYFEDRIWGEHEVGGSAVIYISDIDLDFLAGQRYKPLGDEPFPHFTEQIMSTVPTTFVAVTAAMAGTYLFIRRRDRVMAEEQEDPLGRDDRPDTNLDRGAES